MSKQVQKLVAAVESAAVQFGSQPAVEACATMRSGTASRDVLSRAHLTVTWYAQRWNLG